MITFTIPRTHCSLINYINKHNCVNLIEGKQLKIVYTQNIYVNNLKEQLKNFNDWDIFNRIYFPYEFLGEVYNVYTNNKHCDNNHFFSLRYALHIELIRFIQNNKNKIEQSTPLRTLSISENNDFNLNRMLYIQNSNPNNVYMNIKYSTNISILENRSSMDHITIGTHSTTEDEHKYGKVSYVCVLKALCLQKKDGNLILKLFNIDSPLSSGIITLLTSMYKDVFIAKPETSYGHLSEVFIVCKTFLPDNSDSFYNNILDIVDNMPDIDNSYEIYTKDVVNLVVLNKINEVAVFFYQRQLDIIHTMINTTLSQSIINSSPSFGVNGNKGKVQSIIKSNVEKCVMWICQYNYSSKFYNQSEIIALIDIITINILPNNRLL
jgi:hypothetical protein